MLSNGGGTYAGSSPTADPLFYFIFFCVRLNNGRGEVTWRGGEVLAIFFYFDFVRRRWWKRTSRKKQSFFVVSAGSFGFVCFWYFFLFGDLKILICWGGVFLCSFCWIFIILACVSSCSEVNICLPGVCFKGKQFGQLSSKTFDSGLGNSYSEQSWVKWVVFVGEVCVRFARSLRFFFVDSDCGRFKGCWMECVMNFYVISMEFIAIKI